MNTGRRAAALLMALHLAAGTAHAEAAYAGTVIAGETVNVTAPFSGMVASVSLREGEWLQPGDSVAVLETQKVFAALDGTVRGLNGTVGGNAEGTMLCIAPVSKYTISASVEDAYSAVDTTYVRVGETVYIACATDGTHQAVGVIKAAKGLSFTVETTRGELYMEERVNIYRSAGYEAQTRVGRGTVSRTAEVAVSGEGTLTALHVSEGEEVERGQLLFETVQDAAAGSAHTGGVVLAEVGGAITEVQVQTGASVKAGDTLLTVCPREGYQVMFSVPESALTDVCVGDAVTLRFYQDEENPRDLAGVVESISYVGQEIPNGETTYEAAVAFEADELVRLGMTVTVLTGK